MQDPAREHDPRSWWQTVASALRGTTHDYTAGSIGQSIVLLAIPMVWEMVMESLFALSDVFFVARLGVMGALFVVFTRPIVAAFTTDPAVVEVAVYGLRTMALGFPFFAFGMVLTQAFNGAGDTRTPTRINSAVFWAFELPLAWVLTTRTAMGAHAVFVSVLVAYTLLAALSAVLFRKGAWRTQQV